MIFAVLKQPSYSLKITYYAVLIVFILTLATNWRYFAYRADETWRMATAAFSELKNEQSVVKL